MKRWLDLLARLSRGLLFQGGYVATPAALARLSDDLG